MNVSLKSSSPEEVACDALVYFLTSDTSTLYRGDLAEIDWNLDGRISKGVASGYFPANGTGVYLFSRPPTLAISHILIVPSGMNDRFDFNLDTIVKNQLIPALVNLDIRDVCISLVSFDNPSFLKEAILHIAGEFKNIGGHKLTFLLSLSRAKELSTFFRSKKLF